MSDNTSLGDRMKTYERIFRQVLPRRAYTVLRLDGRAFHSYLRHVAKPFDMGFIAEMDMVTKRLCEDIQGAQCGYTQSDEISILMTDFESTQSEPWVGGRVDKTISLSAGLASAYLARLRQNHPGLPTFDCRVYSFADSVEVANYFLWRQQDATRNSIQMLGQHYFTQEQLFGQSCDQIQEMLYNRHKINWNDLDEGLKRGRIVFHDEDEGWMTIAPPVFKAEPGTALAQLIPPLPSLH